MAKYLKSGGWYRDRTCDPYHVKVHRTSQAIEIICQIVSNVGGLFALRCLISRPIAAIERPARRATP